MVALTALLVVAEALIWICRFWLTPSLSVLPLVSNLSRGKPLCCAPSERRCPCSDGWSRLPHPARGWCCRRRRLQEPDGSRGRRVHQRAFVPKHLPQRRGQEWLDGRNHHFGSGFLSGPVGIPDGQPVAVEPRALLLLLLLWIRSPAGLPAPPVLPVSNLAPGALWTRPALRHHQRHHHVRQERKEGHF